MVFSLTLMVPPSIFAPSMVRPGTVSVKVWRFHCVYISGVYISPSASHDFVETGGGVSMGSQILSISCSYRYQYIHDAAFQDEIHFCKIFCNLSLAHSLHFKLFEADDFPFLSVQIAVPSFLTHVCQIAYEDSAFYCIQHKHSF